LKVKYVRLSKDFEGDQTGQGCLLL